MDLNPRGPKHCICKDPCEDFPCDLLMDAEDGLCKGCRDSPLCRSWRRHRAETEASK